MKTNYIVSAMLVAGVLLAGSSAMAQENWLKALVRGDKTEAKASVSRSPKATPSAINLACVGAAVNARETVLSGGAAKFSDTIKTAYQVRASALAAAFAKTTAAEVRIANKAAWTQFDTSVKTAGREWKATQKSAWTTFRTAIKACGGSSEVSDESNSSKEISGD